MKLKIISLSLSMRMLAEIQDVVLVKNRQLGVIDVPERKIQLPVFYLKEANAPNYFELDRTYFVALHPNSRSIIGGFALMPKLFNRSVHQILNWNMGAVHQVDDAWSGFGIAKKLYPYMMEHANQNRWSLFIDEFTNLRYRDDVYAMGFRRHPNYEEGAIYP